MGILLTAAVFLSLVPSREAATAWLDRMEAAWYERAGVHAEWTVEGEPYPFSGGAEVLATIGPDGTPPRLPVRVRLAEGFLPDGPVRWRAWLDYAEHGREDDPVAVAGRSERPQFDIGFGPAARGGDCGVELRVPWKHADGRRGVARLASAGVIRGSNPDKAAIRERLGRLELQVIAYRESRFAQFDPMGNPKHGQPRGFGVMQLDTPAPTVEQIWDWRANVDAGAALYAAKEEEARTYPARVRRRWPAARDFTPEELKAEAYQRYNGGAYWNWDDALGEWVAAPRNDYADRCLEIESRVLADDFPPEWE